MNGTFENRLAALGNYLERALQREFPSWTIEQTPAGNWLATLPRRGIVIADSAMDLQTMLHAYELRTHGDLLS